MSLIRILLALAILVYTAAAVSAEEEHYTLSTYYTAPSGQYQDLSVINFVAPSNLYFNNANDAFFGFDYRNPARPQNRKLIITGGKNTNGRYGAAVTLFGGDYPTTDASDLWLAAGGYSSPFFPQGSIRMQTEPGLRSNPPRDPTDRLIIGPGWSNGNIIIEAPTEPDWGLNNDDRCNLYVKGNDRFTRIMGKLYIAPNGVISPTPDATALLHATGEIGGSGFIFPGNQTSDYMNNYTLSSAETPNASMPNPPASLILYNTDYKQLMIYKKEYATANPPVWKPLLTRDEVVIKEGTINSGASRADTHIDYRKCPKKPIALFRGSSSYRAASGPALNCTQDAVTSTWWINRNDTGTNNYTLYYTVIAFGVEN